jgi:hypothetical protein
MMVIMKKDYAPAQLDALIGRLGQSGLAGRPIVGPESTFIDVVGPVFTELKEEIESMDGVGEVVQNRYQTDDVRILDIRELLSPEQLIKELPITETAARNVFEARQAVHRVLHGADDRLVVIIGPCSIHDVGAAREYAERLKEARERLSNELLIVMRV